MYLCEIGRIPSEGRPFGFESYFSESDFYASLSVRHESPIKACIVFLSATRNPVLSSSSWDGRRSMFWRNRPVLFGKH